MKQKHYIALFHPVREEVKVRIDFNTEIEETAVYEILKLNGFNIYQFILPDYQFVMSFKELQEKEVRFELFKKEKSTWCGLSKKVEQEILIYPKTGFYYPYQYGSYFYLYSREEINGNEFINWMNEQFPKRWFDFDDTLAGLRSDSIKLLHESNYIVITNHDYQKEFGVVANKDICDALIAELKQAAFESFEFEEYVQNKE